MPADTTDSELPTSATPAAAAPRPSGPRVPTLNRLVCQAFEPFLSDRQDDPRMPGLIPRTMIGPWWNALTALCADELVRFEVRLKTIIGTGEFEEADPLAVELQKAAIDWNLRVLAAIERPAAHPAIAAVAANPLLVDDIREVARILPIAAALKSRLAITFSLLAEDGQMEGRRIYGLSGDAIVTLRQQYTQFADRVGADAAYFALAVLNRMLRPWQMLLVGRALAWQPHERNARYPEFDTVAQRLVLELKRMAREIAALARKDDLAAFMPVINSLAARYFDEVNGMIGTFGPTFTGDDASWNVLTETRTVLAAAFDRTFVDRVAALVLRADEPDGEPAIPAAELMAIVVENGPRYGFGGEARDCRERLGRQVETKAGAIIAALQTTPNRGSQTQAYAMLRVVEIMFKDAQGAQLARSLRMARQFSAA